MRTGVHNEERVCETWCGGVGAQVWRWLQTVKIWAQPFLQALNIFYNSGLIAIPLREASVGWSQHCNGHAYQHSSSKPHANPQRNFREGIEPRTAAKPQGDKWKPKNPSHITKRKSSIPSSGDLFSYVYSGA